jgi:UDP-N-acetylmuramate dehydrogenase
MSVLELPRLEGEVEPQGSLADFIWFRTGGPAEWLVRPKSIGDLSGFLTDLDPRVPVLPSGWAPTSSCATAACRAWWCGSPRR